MTQHASLNMFLATVYLTIVAKMQKKKDEEKKGESLCCRTATVGRKGF